MIDNSGILNQRVVQNPPVEESSILVADGIKVSFQDEGILDDQNYLVDNEDILAGKVLEEAGTVDPLYVPDQKILVSEILEDDVLEIIKGERVSAYTDININALDDFVISDKALTVTKPVGIPNLFQMTDEGMVILMYIPGTVSNGTTNSREDTVKEAAFSIVEVKGIEVVDTDSNKVKKIHEDSEEIEISKYYLGYNSEIGGKKAKIN